MHSLLRKRFGQRVLDGSEALPEGLVLCRNFKRKHGGVMMLRSNRAISYNIIYIVIYSLFYKTNPIELTRRQFHRMARPKGHDGTIALTVGIRR